MADFVSATLPAAAAWGKVAWNGSVFCAITSGTTSATSSDGINWVAGTVPSNAADITSNGSVFVLTLNSSTATSYTSTDGVIWTPQVMPSAQFWSDVAWNGSVFCAITVGTVAATSPDGVTWSPQVKPDMTGLTIRSIHRASFGFCVLVKPSSFSPESTNVYTSADGVSWNTVGRPSRIRNALSTDGTRSIVPIEGAGSLVESSVDGVTWADVSLPAVGGGYKATAWNGLEFVVVELSGDDAATSPDGVVWSPLVLPVSTTWTWLESGGTTFVAVASGSATSLVSTVVIPVDAFWTNLIRTTEIV